MSKLTHAARAMRVAIGGASLLGLFGLTGCSHAVNVARSGCEAGELSRCTELAGYYREGREVGADLGQTVRLLDRACEGGHAEACARLGDLADRGEGVPVDPARAFSLRQRACDAAYAPGCHALALMIEEGSSRPRNTILATVYYERACDRGVGAACTRVGYLYVTGEAGARSSPERAADAWQRGCRVQDAHACAQLRELGLPLRPASAVPASILSMGHSRPSAHPDPNWMGKE